jgi:thiol-disulfide isomerase/thioredoxin
MRYIPLFLFFLVSMQACKWKTIYRPAVIKGNVTGIPANEVYLTNAYQWQIFIDSAEYVDGNFHFSYKTDSLFEPFAASICYIDKQGRIQQLAYRNYILSNPKKEFGNSAFILEPGITLIKGSVHPANNNAADKLDITAGGETEVFFKTQFLDFGIIGETESAKRASRLADFKTIIQQHPSSHYLLSAINDHKRTYTNKELMYLLSFFDKKILHSMSATNIIQYVKGRNSQLHNSADLAIPNEKGLIRRVIDTGSKVNIIVLWASWCGPCQFEIPALKRMVEKFLPDGLHMVSISIDNDQAAWRTALLGEAMDWDQLIVPANDMESFKNRFNILFIPITIICDKKGNELSRFIGYDDKEEEQLDSLLNKYLGPRKM